MGVKKTCPVFLLALGKLKVILSGHDCTVCWSLNVNAFIYKQICLKKVFTIIFNFLLLTIPEYTTLPPPDTIPTVSLVVWEPCYWAILDSYTCNATKVASYIYCSKESFK